MVKGSPVTGNLSVRASDKFFRNYKTRPNDLLPAQPSMQGPASTAQTNGSISTASFALVTASRMYLDFRRLGPFEDSATSISPRSRVQNCGLYQAQRPAKVIPLVLLYPSESQDDIASVRWETYVMQFFSCN